MKELRPIHITENYYEAIEREILKHLSEEIYKPIYDIIVKFLSVKVLTNAKRSALAEAIIKGRVQYIEGRFEGKFDANITRELKKLGAKFSPFKGVFFLTQDKMTPEISDAVAQSYSSAKELNRQISKYLQSIDAQSIANKLNLTGKYGKAIEAYNKEIVKTLGKYSKNTIQMSQEFKRRISEEYSKSARPYIKDWIDSEVLRLRKKVQANAFSGYRSSALVKDLSLKLEKKKDDTGHNVYTSASAKAKAQFLARQETSLMLSKVREVRYRDAGIKKYKWSTSLDERVREFHKKLHGKIFRWDDPPITDEKGNKNNPGEDFNCRCVARPVID